MLLRFLAAFSAIRFFLWSALVILVLLSSSNLDFFLSILSANLFDFLVLPSDSAFFCFSSSVNFPFPVRTPLRVLLDLVVTLPSLSVLVTVRLPSSLTTSLVPFLLVFVLTFLSTLSSRSLSIFSMLLDLITLPSL